MGDGEIHPWWRVDLEDEHCIRTITIINRIDCCSKYILVLNSHTAIGIALKAVDTIGSL